MFYMPHRARVCVDNNCRRLQNRTHIRERRRFELHAAQENRDAPVDDAVNELDEVQLQHPEGNDPLAMEADHPILNEEDGTIEDDPIQISAPHLLGDMDSRCPHCGAQYFQKECTTQHIFTKCCFQGRVSLSPIQIPSQNIVDLFNGSTAQSRHFLENI